MAETIEGRGLSYTGKACHHAAVRRLCAVRKTRVFNADSRRIRQMCQKLPRNETVNHQPSAPSQIRTKHPARAARKGTGPGSATLAAGGFPDPFIVSG